MLLQLGQIEAWRANEDAARTNLQSALTLAQQVKHPETEAEAELTLAQIDFESDDLRNADDAVLRCLKICVTAGDRRGAANAPAWLAKLDLRGGSVAGARARMAEALMAFHAFDMRDQLLTSLDDHASLALALGQTEAAVTLASSAQQLRSNAGTQRAVRAETRWMRFIDKLAATLGETLQQHANWQVAKRRDTPRALREALRLSMPAGQLHAGQPASEAIKPNAPFRRQSDALAADRAAKPA